MYLIEYIWYFSIISFFIHIPRILIEIKSRYCSFKYFSHGEDSYQKSRNLLDNKDKRIISWNYFDMPIEKWEEYLDSTIPQLINLCKTNFYNILGNIRDDQIVSFKNNSDVISYNICGDVIAILIDKKNQIIKTCFNHEWCSGQFFIQYGTIILNGDNIKIMSYPKTPFVVEYNFIKMLLNKPHKPISTCFNTNISNNDIKRIYFQINISDYVSNIPYKINKRSIILWNILTILNTVHKKDYNILIPIPFYNMNNIWNNIGAIFIKWPKSGLTVMELEKTIMDNAYNAIASNIFLRGNVSSLVGKNIRSNVDIVFSSTYIKNPKIITKSNIVTFSDVADYGIYCLTTTVKDKTDITLTFSTNNFNFERLLIHLKNININYMLL